MLNNAAALNDLRIPLLTGWKSLLETGLANTASGSMTNGGFVLNGVMGTPTW